MKPSRILSTSAAVLIASVITAPQPSTAAVSVTAGGITVNFSAAPVAGDFASLSLAGDGATYGTNADLDAAAQLRTSAQFTAAPPTIAEATPSGNAVFRYNSTNQYLQSKPTGNGAATMLVTMNNATGAGISNLKLTYDYGRASNATVEQIEGHRVFFSPTGLANSWILIPGLSGIGTATPGLNSTFATSGWAAGTNAFLLFLDDNQNGGGDDAFTIDNMNFLPTIVIARNLTYNLSHTVGGAPNGTLEVSSNPYWLNGAVPSGFAALDTINLSTDGTATINVPANISVATMRASATTGNYSIGGAGRITGILEKTNAGTLTLTSANNFSSTLLNGGTIATQHVAALGNGTVTIGATGGTLDTTSDLELPGGLAGSGAFTKTGAGKLTLAAAPTQSGGITINGGTLQLNSGLPTGSVTVNTGGRLAGAGTIAGITTINTGGQLEAGVAGSGTLTLAGLVLSSGTKFIASTTSTVTVTNTDGLVVNGGANSVTVDFSGSAAVGVYPVLTYNGSITGAAGAGALALGTPPLRAVATLDHSTNGGGGQFSLSVTGADFPVWTGATDGNWSTAVLGGLKNWALNSNGAPTDFITGDNVLFNDLAGITTVDIAGADVIPTTVVFNNSVSDYTLTGSHGIAGGAAVTLTKNGAAGLIITNTNSFGGGLVINGGYISANTIGNAGTPSAIGAGNTITINGGEFSYTGAAATTDRSLSIGASGAILNSTAGLTVNSVVSGAGGLKISGAGTITLGGGANANTYGGTTVVEGGTLVAGKTAGTIAIPGNLTVETGARFQFAGNNTGNQIADTATVTVNGGVFGNFPAIGTDPTNPGAAETVAAVSVTGGTLSTGRAVFTTTGAASVTDGQIAVVRGGTFITDSLSITGPGIVGLDGGSTTATAGANRRLRVGPGGLVLSDGTINFNVVYGTSTVGTSTGSRFELAGDVTSTGNSSFVRLNTQLTVAVAEVDLQGLERTFNVEGSLAIGTAAAPISLMNGGLIKAGAGTLIIAGTQPYVGNTTINGGALQLDGTLASGTVTIGTGANLTGRGTVNTAVVQSGGSLTAGISGSGNLNLNTLILGAAGGTTTLNVTRSQTPAIINVTGLTGLVPAGTVTVNVAGTTGVGRHTLIDYNGTIGGDGFGAFVRGTLPNRVIATLVDNTATSTIELDVTSVDRPVWSGSLNNLWSAASLALPKNWVLASDGITPTDYIETDDVLFDDTATGTNVSIPAPVTPSLVTFNNELASYTLGGAAGIEGGTPLIKSGAGKLTITNQNSFTGSVSINGGVISVATVADGGVPSPLGAGNAISFNGGTLEYTGIAASMNRPITANAGGATISTSADLTLSGSISGSGSFTKIGSGTVFLTATNTAYQGSVIIKEGTLNSTVNGLGNGTGTPKNIVLDGGILSNSEAAAVVFNDGATLLRVLSVTAAGGGIDVASATGIFTLSRADGLTGTGKLTKTGPGLLRITTDNPNFSGDWELNAGQVEVQVAAPNGLGTGKVTLHSGSTLSWQSAGAAPAAQVTLPNHIVLDGGTLTTRSGDRSIYGGNIDVVAESFVLLRSSTSNGNSNSITFDGLLSGTAPLNITGLNPQTNGGNKALYLTNTANTYSGTFKVAKNQILFSLPLANTGNTLGTATIELDEAALALRDDGPGSNTSLAYGNDVVIAGQGGQIDVNRALIASVNTGNTFRLGSLSIGTQQFFTTGGNGYKVEFSKPVTFSGTPTLFPDSAELMFSGGVAGAAGFIKDGPETLSFHGINPIAGIAEIRDGTFEVNGTLSNPLTDIQVGPATVGGAPTVAGSGSISGSVILNDVASVIAPGDNGPGVLTVDGNVTFLTGSTFTVELASGAGPIPVPGTDYDQLNVAGGVALNDANLNLTLSGGVNIGDIFFILINGDVDPVSGIFAGLPDNSIIFVGADTFRITYDAESTTGLADGGNDVALLAIPEPGSAAMLLGGLAMLAGCRRRRV